MSFEKFYKLNRDERWIDNPYEVGGRDTGVSNIANTLVGKVKEMFPINEAPAHLVNESVMLLSACLAAEKAIENYIELVSEYLLDKKG